MLADKKSGGCFRRVLILLFLAGIAFGGLAGFRAGPGPEITVQAALPGIGKRTPVSIVVEEPKRGLSSIRVELVQGERVELLADRRFTAREPWEFWGDRVRKEELAVDVGSETVKGLKEGPATIRVSAGRAPSLLRRPAPAIRELTLQVKLRPPMLAVHSAQTYVAQGGCEAVVYRPGESSVEDGVQAGKWWFPGHPTPGGGGLHFALFSAPYDLDNPAEIRLVARDDVGNEARVSFVDRFTPKPVRKDTIELDEKFMTTVVPAILAQTPEIEDKGEVLENYLEINGQLRRKNAETLTELGRKSAPEFHWSQPFANPLRNSAVTSSFADRRTYVYQGRAVDQQDHLGFDLASTRLAPIGAANDGVVVLARYFGIYGNAVVIDHGYGLMSLYGHLSSIGVQEGQQVRRDEEIGRSGATGLAGGDHLHFTMLLQGLPVDPREWWDSHWIHDRLKLKLESALPFQD